MRKNQIVENINCPNCNEPTKLVSDLNDIYVGKVNQKIWVNFLNYQCDSCEESFTTNEVDELNLREINRGIRVYKRQLKIKKMIK